ncbi:thioredoxin-dependent thiol peroxidase [Aureibaculum conchae]|uniref:thioredoxin-dependent thiol peroxidase n=1 Tax=Aureibaculum sp. 2308TA14-22 TaxID=3108392 RepID=UPI003390F3A1
MTTLKIGERAPDFKATDHEGETRNLEDYSGNKLILFFYPRASTPGCTAEVCNLRDNYSNLKEKGFALLGVSADTERKQGNFVTKNSLPFPLLADVDKEVINAYKVWGPKKFMGREFDGIYRTTFVIDEKGIIENIITKVKTKDHAAQILS